MYNKQRVKIIVGEWFELKTSIILSDETLIRLVDDITESKALNIPVVSESLRIVSDDKCVNSKLVADWVAIEGQEHCQCIVGCKIKVVFIQNGHKSHPYIVDQLEYEKLVDKTKV